MRQLTRAKRVVQTVPEGARRLDLDSAIVRVMLVSSAPLQAQERLLAIRVPRTVRLDVIQKAKDVVTPPIPV
jgi:hypothetical protein